MPPSGPRGILCPSADALQDEMREQMTVFISHSFGDQAEFGNVIDCSVCIFIATHESVKSSYCGAELGAFYAGSNAPQYKREAAERGAQGSTNAASELVEMVTQALGPSTQVNPGRR